MWPATNSQSLSQTIVCGNEAVCMPKQVDNIDSVGFVAKQLNPCIPNSNQRNTVKQRSLFIFSPSASLSRSSRRHSSGHASAAVVGLCSSAVPPCWPLRLRARRRAPTSPAPRRRRLLWPIGQPSDALRPSAAGRCSPEAATAALPRPAPPSTTAAAPHPALPAAPATQGPCLRSPAMAMQFGIWTAAVLQLRLPSVGGRAPAK